MSNESIYRGEQAARIMAEPLVIEALAAIKANVRDLFFELKPEQAGSREMLHLMDRARQQFENVFRLHIAGMTVSKYELLDEANTAARVEAVRRTVLER